MEKRSKQHHFVPKVLQKQFLAEDNRIWFSERNQEGSFSAPEQRNINKTFRIRNYYTTLENDFPSDSVEKSYYGQIDNFLGEALPQILDLVENRIPPQISPDTLTDIREIVLAMTKRTPDSSVDLGSDLSIGRDLVEQQLKAVRKLGVPELESPYQKILEDPVQLQNRGRDIRVRSAIQPSPLCDESLRDFSIRWVVSGTHHSFILSSRMTFWIGNGGPNGFVNPHLEIWFPLSPKVSLVLLRDPSNQFPSITVNSSSHIRELNEYAARNSNQIASHSKRLLESITGKLATTTQKKGAPWGALL
jgi:hypothetical protein